MKKFLLASSIIMLCTPMFAFAAFNDVTLTSSTVFLVGSIPLNVSGSNAVVASTTVTATSLIIQMQVGSIITISAPNKNQITQVGGTGFVSSTQCDGTASLMTLSTPASSATVTITPLGTLCAAPVVVSGGGGGGGGSGGGGGGVLGGPLAYGFTATSSTATTTIAASTTTPTNLQIPNYTNKHSPHFQTSTKIVSVVPSAYFARNLKKGSHGDDVKALQDILIIAGFLIGPSSGFYDLDTVLAVKQFQKAHGIKPLGTVGPKTREYLNQTYGAQSNTPLSVSTDTATSKIGYKFSSMLKVGSRGKAVLELQKRLKAEGLFSGNMTNYFGQGTKAAVQAYQNKNGLQPLGIVGPATRALLNK